MLLVQLHGHRCLTSLNRFSPNHSQIFHRILFPSLYQYAHQRCHLSQNSPDKKGFFGNFLDNIKQEMAKSKEMKENIKKFREEAQKLEESEALKKAREKFEAIEAETFKGSQQVKDQLNALKKTFEKTLEEASKTDIGRQGLRVSEELLKQAKQAAESIAKQSHQIGESTPVKTAANKVKAIKEEVDDVTVSGPRVYVPPTSLRKRKENTDFGPERIISINKDATGVELHKDSKWYKSWENFKENNQYINKVFDWKMRYDESDNPVVRVSRAFTDKISDVFSGMFTKSELSEALTEICKIDPDFDKSAFLKECEAVIIPNILEAMVRGDLEILKDWCHESVYSRLKVPIEEACKHNYVFDSKILDVSHVDLAMGKIMEQGPVLIITFQTQQIMALRDFKGNIIEGDPDKVIRFNYVWCLCRDQEELDPKAAWRLLDLSANSSSQWL